MVARNGFGGGGRKKSVRHKESIRRPRSSTNKSQQRGKSSGRPRPHHGSSKNPSRQPHGTGGREQHPISHTGTPRRSGTYRTSSGQIKAVKNKRKGHSLWDTLTKAATKTIKKVCTGVKKVVKDTVKKLKKVDWKKVGVTVAAIGVGMALTAVTGGLGAPLAMAIGGAASGAILSGYDAYSSGKRGWALAGSILKGATTGAVTGFIGGQFVGVGASVATNVTQNISHQAVRQVAKFGVESAVETAIDTGIDLASGNQVTGQTVAMNFAFNLVSNGAGSVSTKKAPKADVQTNKPKSGDVPVTRPIKGVTPVQQLALPGPTSRPLALPAPTTSTKTDFYVNPDGTTYLAADVATGNQIDRLYHYTSDKGLEGIVNSGQMYPSLKANNPKDARYGNGQYFTDIIPGSLTNSQLSSKFITIPFQGKKFANYVEVDATGLGAVKGRDGVYVVPNTSSLDISRRILDYGKN